MSHKLTACLSAISLCVLTACGGGGEGGDTDNNENPRNTTPGSTVFKDSDIKGVWHLTRTVTTEDGRSAQSVYGLKIKSADSGDTNLKITNCVRSTSNAQINQGNNTVTFSENYETLTINSASTMSGNGATTVTDPDTGAELAATYSVKAERVSTGTTFNMGQIDLQIESFSDTIDSDVCADVDYVLAATKGSAGATMTLHGRIAYSYSIFSGTAPATVTMVFDELDEPKFYSIGEDAFSDLAITVETSETVANLLNTSAIVEATGDGITLATNTDTSIVMTDGFITNDEGIFVEIDLNVTLPFVD